MVIFSTAFHNIVEELINISMLWLVGFTRLIKFFQMSMHIAFSIGLSYGCYGSIDTI